MRILFLASLVLLPAMATQSRASASESAEPFVASGDSETREHSLQCLTQAIYYEARSESDNGQRAVAQVVLNRVRHPSYANSVCGVVFQGAERSTGCQFSFACDGSMNRPVEPAAWERAQRIAAAALSGSVYRPVGLALNYHTTAIHPYWAPTLVPQLVLGAHIFYRRPGLGGTSEAFSQAPVEDEGGYIPQPRVASRRLDTSMRASHVRYAAMPIVEIPVYERPLRVRGYGAEQAVSTAGRRMMARPAALRTAPRIVLESGVRVSRGS